MEIKPSVRSELREPETAPMRKGSAAKVTMVGKYILEITAVNEEKSSNSGQAKTVYKLGGPALYVLRKPLFGSIHARDGDARTSMRCGASYISVISASAPHSIFGQFCVNMLSRFWGNSRVSPIMDFKSRIY